MKLRFKLFIFTLLSVMVLMSTTAVAALPPVNAEIGNQATLEYYNAVGVHRTIVSNIVITNVQAFYGFTVDGSGSGSSIIVSAESETTTYFTHEIVNTSNTVASFTFAATIVDSQISSANVFIDGAMTTGISLEAGESKVVTVHVTSNDTTTVDEDYDYTLSVTCSNMQMTDTRRTVIITDSLHIVSSVAIIQITNETDITTGTLDDEIKVTYHIQNTTTVASGKFELVMDLQEYYSFVSNKSVDYTYVIGGVTKTGTFILDEEKTVDGIKFVYNGSSIVITCDTIEQVVAADTLTVSYYIKCNQLYSSNYYIHYNYQYQEKTTDTEYISITNTTACSYEVISYFAVDITGQHKVAEQGSLVIFANKVTNTGNKDDAFDITLLEDAFPGGTEFYLAYGPDLDEAPADYVPTEIEKVPLIDTNNNGIVDTGIIEPGKTRYILLFAQLPIDGVGSGYKIKNQATSCTLDTAFNQAYDTLTIDESTVDITCNYSVDDDLAGNEDIGKGRGPESTPVVTAIKSSGDTAYFLLYVNNTNQFLTEEYTIDYSFDSEFKTDISLEGVSVEIQSVDGAYISSTGPIAPGGCRPLRAIVRSTNLTLAQSFNIYFRVSSKTTTAVDIINEMIVIEESRNLAIIPDLQAETYPNTTVVYSHIIVNRGNVIEGDDINSKVLLTAEEYTLDKDGAEVTDSTLFTSTLFWDRNNNGVLEESIDPHIEDLSMAGIEGLYPGESIRIFCEVHVGIKAEADMVDTTTIKLDISSNSYAIKEMEMLAIDTTTIKADNLHIVKRQGKLENITDLVPDEYTNGEIDADPGDVICYEITVTNTGNEGVSNVSIEDLVPQFTTLFEEATVQYEDDPATASNVIQPALNGRGIIQANLSWLGAGESAVLRFKVKINDSND